MAYAGTNPEWDTDKFRYGYTSLTTPNSVYEHDLNTRSDTLLKQQEVVGDFDASRYASERIWAPARDGVRVPVSIVYRKGTRHRRHRTAAALRLRLLRHQHGPHLQQRRLSLLDRGFVFAIAHIRGGEELGRAWYENGKMEHKMNTFTDFIDCAEHLVKKKYADPERLFCMGGSAGGLLMGAVVNMRPDLWNGVVAEVPFVDVVTTMLDDSIPLTTGEFDEWGDPEGEGGLRAHAQLFTLRQREGCRAIRRCSCSPVSTTARCSIGSRRNGCSVCANIRRAGAPILLHTNMEAGHGGASGRFERLKEVALIYAFLLQQAGTVKLAA